MACFRLAFLSSLILLFAPVFPAVSQDTSATSVVPAGSKARSTPRIIGGNDVGPGQGPWAASLQYQHIEGDEDSWRPFCAGSFVHPRTVTDEAGDTRVVQWEPNRTRPIWLMTAAHCIQNDDGTRLDIDRIRVVGGSRNLASRAAEVQTIEEALTHAAYDPDTYENDIAILHLSAPAKDFEATERATIRLPALSDTQWINQDYLAVIAQGWGTTETGSDSLLLKEVILPLVSRQLCSEKFAVHGEIITPGMLCAGFVSGFFDSCQGDSGGPLIYQHRGNLSFGETSDAVLLGIISWGKGCGNTDLFGVYTRVSVYVDWAEEQVIGYLQQ